MQKVIKNSRQRYVRFNVFATDLNCLECQKSQNCILEVSIQLINFSELQVQCENISLKITGNTENFVWFLKNQDSYHPVEI